MTITPPYRGLPPVLARATMVRVVEGFTRRQRTLLLIGSIGPLGYFPASGTVTVAVVGLPLFWLTRDWPWPMYVMATILFTGAAVWIHTIGDRILEERDSRRLVWDELVGFLFAVAFVPFTWHLAVLAFLLERAIDIVKVPPARWIDLQAGCAWKHWPGGFGVVGDDIVAGLYTCGILHFLIRLSPSSLGLTQ